MQEKDHKPQTWRKSLVKGTIHRYNHRSSKELRRTGPYGAKEP